MSRSCISATLFPHYLATLAISELILFSALAYGQGRNDDSIRELPPNQTVEREMIGAQTHRYRLDLQANEFFQVHVEQKGVDVTLKLLDSNGNVLATMNSPNGKNGPETLSFVMADTGRYVLEVIGADEKAEKGHYAITREAARGATMKDKRRVEVERLFVEAIAARQIDSQVETAIKRFSQALAGWQELNDRYMESLTEQQLKQSKGKAVFLEAKALVNQRSVESLRAALAKFQEASRLFREGGYEYAAAGALLGAALASYNVGERESAIEFYQQTLPYYRASGDRFQEAQVLDSIGNIHWVSRENSAALEYLNQALQLYQALGERLSAAQTLHHIGATYHNMGEKQKALDIFQQILPVLRAGGDKDGEADTRNSMGAIYYESGEYQKALLLYHQALLLKRQIRDTCGTADMLTNIGEIHNVLGEKSKALDFLIKQALPLYKLAGTCAGAPASLNNIGKVYYELGESQKALDYYQQALPLFKAARNKGGEAATLNNLGGVYNASGKHQKALEFYQASLAAYRDTDDRKNEATSLNNLGAVYSALGDHQKALAFFGQALLLRRKVGDRNGEAITLNNMGGTHQVLAEPHEALANFHQALPLFRAVGDRNGEATLLGNLMLSWEALKQRRLAIFYGKQAVNELQQLRGATKGLDNETQKSFLRSVQQTYQKLAELLIKEARLGQAVQVLDLYQDQQFFDFSSGANESVRQTTLTAREQKFAERYEAASDEIGRIGFQIEQIKREIGNYQPSLQQTAQLQKLEAQLESASSEFFAVLEDEKTAFARPPDETDKHLPVPDVTDMQATLLELGAVTRQRSAALYTLIGSDEFHLLLITSKGRVKAFASPVKAADLNEKILQFYDRLQSPRDDASRLGKELYDMIFRPAAAELKKMGARTLMWRLDGPLRYVPMAALWDGKEYLVERYQSVLLTRANRERLTRRVSPNWTGTGFGGSQAQTVDVFGDGDQISFPPLPGVIKELQAIFRGKGKETSILNGEVFADAQFTKDAFYAAMKQRRPLVHVSSHFLFRPGDSSRSFLLLGDGGALTLREMKQQENLFADVELLTLSACNTAASHADADGREIDGFAELAQRLGASAVMATLWSVADESTSLLMSEFYRLRQANPQLTKSEALQRAQKTMIHARYTAGRRPLLRGPVLAGSNGKQVPFKRDERAPYAHPHFWSPFVLMGNWK